LLGTGERFCGLFVFVSNSEMLPVLEYFLRRADCVAEQLSPHTLEVNVPSAPNEEQGRRELNVYLASWQSRHRGFEAHVIEEEVVG
jgi:hypothetical protein